VKTTIRIRVTLLVLALSVFATLPQVASASPLSVDGILGYHSVRPGETLFCLGRAYKVSPWAIASQNGIGWMNAIYAGQVLAIPNVAWANAPAGPTCVRQFDTQNPPPVCRATYTIAFGDTLIGIARRFGVDVFTLAAKNNVYNLNLIFAGHSLCIP